MINKREVGLVEEGVAIRSKGPLAQRGARRAEELVRSIAHSVIHLDIEPCVEPLHVRHLCR